MTTKGFMRSLNFSFMKGAWGLLLGCASLLWTFPAAAAAPVVMPGPGKSNDVWSVYAFGNAQAVSDAFRALNNFSASGVFQDMVGLVALIGIVVMALTSGFNAATAKRLMGYVVGVFITVYVFFGWGNQGPLAVSVEVYDTVDGTWKAPVNVPAVVGIPAAVVSTAGYELTRQIEASFTLPEAMKLSNGAPFNMAASMLQDASKARITDPNLSSSLAYYVQDCFVMGVSDGSLSPTALLTSTNFLNDIHYKHPGVMVNTLLQENYVGVDRVVSCDQAWTNINTYITGLGAGVENFLSSSSAWTGTTAYTVLNAGMDAVAQYATNNGITTGGGMVRQAAVLSAFSGAYRQTSAATGNSDFLTGLALSQAYQSQTTGWVVGAEVFNRVMGYIFAVIQVFVYSITPLVLVAALIPGLGFALLKNFLQITLWLAIWQPMLAIVNFIVLSMQQAELGGALGVSGSHGFTLSNMGIISEKTANLRAAASFVGTMVPALAWALVKGSVDFSRVIGSAVGENFSQQASNTMSTGNYSLNQASMDSFTANKHSIAHSSAQGEGFSNSGAVMDRKLNAGGTMAPTEAGQSMQATVTSTLGTNQGGNRGRVANDVVGGAQSDGTTAVAQFGESGTHSGAAATVTSSQETRQAQAQAGGAVNKALLTQNQGKPGNGLGLTSPPATTSGGNNKDVPPANMEKAPSTWNRANVNVNAGASGGFGGTQGNGNQQIVTDQHAENASRMDTATSATQATRNAGIANSAGNVDGWMANQTQSIVAFGSPALRNRITQSWVADRPSSSIAGRQSDQPVDPRLSQMTQDGFIEKKVEAEKAAIQQKSAGIEATSDKLRGDAIGGMADIQRDADKLIDAQKIKGYDDTKAKIPASQRANDARERVQDSIIKVKDDAIDAGKRFIGLEPDKKSEEPSPAAAPKPPAAPTAKVSAAPGDGQAPVAVAAAGTPGQITNPQGNSPAANQAPVVVASAGAPGAGANPSGPPSSRNTEPEGAQHNAQPPVLLAQLPVLQPQQPTPTPELPSIPQAQLAQGPTEQPGMPMGASQLVAGLDPLNQGQPAATDAQLQSAQHRAEQLEQHRRNADNILMASAESTEVPELQEAIRDARGYTSRA